MRRIAEEAERTQRAKEAEAALRKQQAEEAKTTGYGLRASGYTLGAVGVAALGVSALLYWGPLQNRFKAMDQFNNNPGKVWDSGDIGLSSLHRTEVAVAILIAGGTALVATGVTLCVRYRRRSRAMERLPGVTLVPVIDRSAGVLAAVGSF